MSLPAQNPPDRDLRDILALEAEWNTGERYDDDPSYADAEALRDWTSRELGPE